MSCFVQLTVQNSEICSLQYVKQRKAANPHNEETGTRKRFSYFLIKWLNLVIIYQNDTFSFVHQLIGKMIHHFSSNGMIYVSVTLIANADMVT